MTAVVILPHGRRVQFVNDTAVTRILGRGRVMGVFVTGLVTGEEKSAGTLDDGTPWKKHVLVLLAGTRTLEVRLDKGWEGAVPSRGQEVAVECTVNSYGKFVGVRHCPELDDVIGER